MLLWVYLPPEFLAEILCLFAHALQVVEILGRNALQNFANAPHGELGQIVICSVVVKLLLKNAHKLAPLRLAGFFQYWPCGKDVTNALHTRIVQEMLAIPLLPQYSRQ
mgnify:CR=1 FL=1